MHAIRVPLALLVLICLFLQFLTAAQAQVDDRVLLADKPPKLLSQFGFFTDIASQQPDVAVLPYHLITPLFSDHARKFRFVYVPEGRKITYHPDEAFAFPVGSALIKSFAFPHKLSDQNSALTLLETRVMIRKEEGWQGWSYVWDEDRKDGILKKAGKRLDVSFADLQGNPQIISYKVPNVNQCKGCHGLDGEMVPLGPKARNLNTVREYVDGSEPQLQHWQRRQILANVPDKPTPPVADWRDGKTSLEDRARAYLDVNCAHCHRKGGAASNSGLFLDYHQPDRTAYGVRKRPVAAGRGSGGFEFSIEPGKPERSILIHRMRSNDPGVMMPELGRALVHEEAVLMLEAWIREMR